MTAHDETLITLQEVRGRMHSCRDALRLVLMFHSGKRWDEEHAKMWKHSTGEGEVTTKILCDHIRKVLGEPDGK